jgi:hypothetical protein
MPQIQWVKGDGTIVKDVPGLRQVRRKNIQRRIDS